MTGTAPATLSLVTRRTIRASANDLFRYWTEPDHLLRWFGPADVVCTAAEVDLKVGGRYALTNRLKDGTIVRIVGTFEVIERPQRLVYSWAVEPGSGSHERVTVRFAPQASDCTEIVVVHEHIPDAVTRDSHEAGWLGCLDKLERLLV